MPQATNSTIVNHSDMRPFPSAMFPANDAFLSTAPTLMPQGNMARGIGKFMTYPAPAYKTNETAPSTNPTGPTTTTANEEETAATPQWMYVALGVAVLVGVVLLVEYNR